jgi:hypothetical protein
MSVVTSNREGRGGVNPSSTHLPLLPGEMCRRGARPLATLAVARHHATNRAANTNLRSGVQYHVLLTRSKGSMFERSLV